MKSTSFNLAMTIAASAALVAGSVNAAQSEAEAEVIRAAIVEDVGAQERINFSGKLRMLSQRIPSAACHLAEGIDVEGATKLLAGATIEFEKILTGLEFGDADLGIKGEEKRRKTIAQIHDLRGKWETVKTASEAMTAGDVSDTQLDILLGQNMNVLGSAKLLVSELVGQYSDPTAMLQADSLLIDIAGRQRMLTQKMSKESCMLHSNHATGDTIGHLQGTIQMFEVSLMALRNGLPDAGIKAPPNEEISAGLDVVIGNWTEVKPVLGALIAGEAVDDATETAKFQKLNTTMANMNKVVGMYAEATKLGL